jgi:hypothetical protein
LAKELKYYKVLEFNKGYIKKELSNFEGLKSNVTEQLFFNALNKAQNPREIASAHRRRVHF